MAGTNWPLAKPRFELRDSILVLLPNPLPSSANYRDLLIRQAPVLKAMGARDYHYNRNYDSSYWDVFRMVRLSKILFYKILRTGHTIRLDGSYNEEAEAFKVTAALFKAFYTEVAGNGSFPVIVILASGFDLQNSQTHKAMRYEPLLKFFKKSDFLYWENIEAFNRPGMNYREEDLFQGHYTNLGNRLTGEFLLAKLKSLNTAEAGITSDGRQARKN
jgi:hypothetical protein